MFVNYLTQNPQNERIFGNTNHTNLANEMDSAPTSLSLSLFVSLTGA